jgi:hypothetical protein
MKAPRPMAIVGILKRSEFTRDKLEFGTQIGSYCYNPVKTSFLMKMHLTI